VQRLQARNVPAKRRDFVGDRKKRHREIVSNYLVFGERSVATAHHRSCEQLSIPQGIRDAVRRDRILEIPGVTHQGPSRAPRRPKDPVVTGESVVRGDRRGAHGSGNPRRRLTQDRVKAGGEVDAQIPHEPQRRRRGKY
jgi:hypothetical protein